MTIEELMKRYEDERAKLGISDSFSDPLNVVPPEAKTDYDRCILSEKMRPPVCKSCERCGWNRDELFRRKVLIRSGGLELNDRGLWQLRLRKVQ